MLKLPKEIHVAYNGDWNDLNEFEKEELLSDWLSDTYGFCHNGFAYQEHDGYVHITDIDWDTTE